MAKVKHQPAAHAPEKPTVPGPVVAQPLIAFCGTILVIVTASFVPTWRLWGVNWWGYYPIGLILTLGALSVGLGFVIWKFLSIPVAAQATNENRYWWTTLLIAAVSLAAFYVLRVESHILGDGYTLISLLAKDQPLIKSRNFGGTLLPWGFVRLAGDHTETMVITAYRFTAFFSGLLFLGVAAWLARKLYPEMHRRLLLIGALITGGYSLMFFGYVENYAIVLVAVLLFTGLGVLVVRGTVPHWYAWLAVGLATFCHVFGLMLVPAAAYLSLRETRWGRTFGGLRKSQKVVLAALAGVTGLAMTIAAAHATYTLRFVLLPLWPDQFTMEGYTVFAPAHLLDTANLILLLCPGVAVGAITIAGGGTWSSRDRAELFFLGWTSVTVAAALFVVDPKLGMPRDWDLFAFLGIPLLFWMAHGILRRADTVAGKAALLLIVINAAILIPRAVSLRVNEIGDSHFRAYYELDTLKNRPGRFIFVDQLVKRGDTLAARIETQAVRRDYPEDSLLSAGLEHLKAGRMPQAAEYFERILGVNPVSFNGYANLSTAVIQMNMLDSSLKLLEIARALNPYNAAGYINQATVLHKMNRFKEAEELLLKARELDPVGADPLMSLAGLYGSMGQRDKYLEYLHLIVRHEDAQGPYFRVLAEYYLSRGDYRQAAELLYTGIQKGLDTTYVRGVFKQFPKVEESFRAFIPRS